MRDVDILLVEDNEIDVMAFERGMKFHRLANRLIVAGDGREALEILRRTHPTKTIASVYVIFLDLNMPVMNGLEFLEAIRADNQLDLSVVFVLTTSDHDEDLTQAYKKQVAGYILKKNVGEACRNLHELLQAYWKVVVLP